MKTIVQNLTLITIMLFNLSAKNCSYTTLIIVGEFENLPIQVYLNDKLTFKGCISSNGQSFGILIPKIRVKKKIQVNVLFKNFEGELESKNQILRSNYILLRYHVSFFKIESHKEKPMII